MTTTRNMARLLALVVLLSGCGSQSDHRGPRLTRLDDTASAVSRARLPQLATVATPSELLRTRPLEWEHSPMMRGLGRLTAKMRSSAYVHGVDVDVRRGHYGFDCSGMVEWVLRDAAPLAHGNLKRNLVYRPLARDFVAHVGQLAPGTARGGWMRVARVADAQPGDVIAWLKPKFIKSINTGHVAVIVQVPRLRGAYDTAYVLRVADSSRLRHEDDSRAGREGFGYGTILVETDPNTGAPSGFSFAGSRARHAFGTKVVIGRPLR